MPDGRAGLHDGAAESFPPPSVPAPMPHAPIPATAARTPDGRVVLYAIATGARYTRQDDQAADLLASGAFTTDDPNGIPAITPAVPATPAPAAPRRRGRRGR